MSKNAGSTNPNTVRKPKRMTLKEKLDWIWKDGECSFPSHRARYMFEFHMLDRMLGYTLNGPPENLERLRGKKVPLVHVGRSG